ncbi:MAG: phage tail sheath family protein [Anaerolineae bacterium]|nr:phage tail sheath family protein [Anaerolineae bacterium]
MPQYLSPGVYVEDVPPLVRPIAGVGTSTAGFVGVVPNNIKMPDQPGQFKKDKDGNLEKDEQGNPIPVPYTVAEAGKPQLITGWEQFKNNFGDLQADNKTLAHAVYGFFNNGGTRCWITRVVNAAGLTSGLAEALRTFEPIDEIAIVAVPGATSDAQHSAILSHCFKMKDRVAILDGVQSASVQNPEAIAPFGRGETGTYGAVYYPWIKIFDPLTADDPKTKGILPVPPSGHLAGIYARSDSTRGVHKAPANEVVIGALDVDIPLSKADQDGLNPEGINVIRSFNGTIKVWGARTRTDESHSEFRYVSTRRFLNFARESIEEGTQWVVFEPNSPVLWQRITRNVSDFLLGQWQAGALFGNSPKEAFFVKCDAETNPPNVRELGQVVTEIGVAIVKPAEFVIFRIQQMTGG